MAWYFYCIALIPLVLLLIGEKKENRTLLVISKPLLSVLFLSTALFGPLRSQGYFLFVLIGLSLSVVGDICLIFFSSKKIFSIGLAAFLTGHIAYSIAFFTHGGFSLVLLLGALPVMLSALIVYRWLKPYLGEMKISVVAYIAIISTMLLGALSLILHNASDLSHRLILFSAALIFYVSDLFVARQKFVKKQWLNRAIGLPLYFTAQVLIAFSCRWII